MFERCLRWGLRHGRWLLLFDSFDEIPALLAAEDSEQASGDYAKAIQDFATDPAHSACPVIVASRPYRNRSPRGRTGPAWCSPRWMTGVSAR